MRGTRIALGVAAVTVLAGAGAISRELDVGPLARERRLFLVESMSVAAAGPSPALRGSTRRLRVEFDLGGSCGGEGPEVASIDARETATSVRVAVVVREERRTRGACAGVGLYGIETVRLKQPLGVRRIYNPSGRVFLRYVDRRPELPTPRTPPRYRLTPAPVVARGRGAQMRSHRSDLYVYARLAHALPRGAPRPVVMLDDSRGAAQAVPVSGGRRCFRARVPGSADPERAPQLNDAREGQSVDVRLKLGDGRGVKTEATSITDTRTLDMTPDELDRRFLRTLRCG